MCPLAALSPARRERYRIEIVNLIRMVRVSKMFPHRQRRPATAYREVFFPTKTRQTTPPFRTHPAEFRPALY